MEDTENDEESDHPQYVPPPPEPPNWWEYTLGGTILLAIVAGAIWSIRWVVLYILAQ